MSKSYAKGGKWSVRDNITEFQYITNKGSRRHKIRRSGFESVTTHY